MLVGTGVFVCGGVLVGMGVEVAVAVGLAVAGESLADATVYGNPIVPNDIRNPVSRRIRTGRRKRADWVIVAPVDPVFFFNYSESKVFVKREGGAMGFSSQPRGVAKLVGFFLLENTGSINRDIQEISSWYSNINNYHVHCLAM